MHQEMTLAEATVMALISQSSIRVAEALALARTIIGQNSYTPPVPLENLTTELHIASVSRDYFAEDDTYYEIRFELAHKIGHILMQHKNHSWLEEYEADSFAKQLLFPCLIEHSGNPNVSALSDQYEIPPDIVAAILEEKLVEKRNLEERVEWGSICSTRQH